MGQQGLRQASFRAIGSSAGPLNGDKLAAFAAEATIPDGTPINGAFILWLQERLGSVNPSLRGLQAEFAAAEGADKWSSVGSFDPGTPSSGAIDTSVAVASDDGRQIVSTGGVNVAGTTVDMASDRFGVLRFVEAPPAGATGSNFKIQCSAANTNSTALTLAIYGIAVAEQPTFVTTSGNLTLLPLTTASVAWVVPSWTTGDRGAAQLTPDLSAIVDELTAIEGWTGEAIAFALEYTSGGGARTIAAVSHATLAPATLTGTWEIE